MLYQILARLEHAAPKDAEAYQWFTYTGAKMSVTSAKGKVYTLVKDSVFGVRKSSNGKQIRLVEPGKETIVYTITLDIAKKLAKFCKPVATKINKDKAIPPTAPKSGKSWLGTVQRKMFDKELKTGGNTLMSEVDQIPNTNIQTTAAYWTWLSRQYQGSVIPVSRIIVMRQTRLSVKVLLRDLGVHWSSIKLPAPSHIKGIRIRVHALVKPSDVDWPTTISNRVNFPGEQETTLKKGIVPKILRIINLATKAEVPIT